MAKQKLFSRTREASHKSRRDGNKLENETLYAGLVAAWLWPSLTLGTREALSFRQAHGHRRS